MTDQEFSVTKKIGRPKGRSKPETTVLRLEVDAVRMLDDLISKWPDNETRPSRSELIRIIVSDWLKSNS